MIKKFNEFNEYESKNEIQELFIDLIEVGFKKFNESNDDERINEIQEVFAELKDKGFEIGVSVWSNCIDVIIRFPDDGDYDSFRYGDIKDKVIQFIEYYTYYSSKYNGYDSRGMFFSSEDDKNIDKNLYTMSEDLMILNIEIEIAR